MVSRQVFSTEVVGDPGPGGVAVTVCTAQVDLDLETESAARRELSRLAAGTGPVVLDVSEVFVAVIGLRLLLDCVDDMHRAGRRAELVVNRHLHRVAHIVGQPPDVLRSTQAEALARVRAPIPDGGATPRDDAAAVIGRAGGVPILPGGRHGRIVGVTGSDAADPPW